MESVYAQVRSFPSVQYYVNKIHLAGNKNFSGRQIKKQLNLKDKKLFKKITFTRRLLELDRKALETLYVKNGYLECVVRDSFAIGDKGAVDVFFFIEERTQFYLKDVTILGAKSINEATLYRQITHKSGDPYNPILIREAMKSIITMYSNSGKPLVFVDDSLVTNENIHLFIKIKENPTMRIGDIKIVNTQSVSEAVVRREIVLKRGDLFSQAKIERSQKRIFETLEPTDEKLVEEIRANLFTFDDLLKLDDRTLQRVLRDVNKQDLVLALKGAPDKLKEKVYKNMSERARETLREELEILGPQLARDVYAAQRRIVDTVRYLEESGEIVIAGGSGDEIIV